MSGLVCWRCSSAVQCVVLALMWFPLQPGFPWASSLLTVPLQAVLIWICGEGANPLDEAVPRKPSCCWWRHCAESWVAQVLWARHCQLSLPMVEALRSGGSPLRGLEVEPHGIPWAPRLLQVFARKCKSSLGRHCKWLLILMVVWLLWLSLAMEGR